MRIVHPLFKLDEPMPEPSFDPKTGEVVLKLKVKFGNAELRLTADEVHELAAEISLQPVG